METSVSTLIQINKVPGLGTGEIQWQKSRVGGAFFGRMTCWAIRRTAARAVGLDWGTVRDLGQLWMKAAVCHGGRRISRAVHRTRLENRCFWTGPTILTPRSSMGVPSPPPPPPISRGQKKQLFSVASGSVSLSMDQLIWVVCISLCINHVRW